MTDDLYGNPEQVDTPTERLLVAHRKMILESDSHFKLGCHVFPSLSRVAVAEALRLVADDVEQSKAERFRFEYTIEEVKE